MRNERYSRNLEIILISFTPFSVHVKLNLRNSRYTTSKDSYLWGLTIIWVCTIWMLFRYMWGFIKWYIGLRLVKFMVFVIVDVVAHRASVTDVLCVSS